MDKAVWIKPLLKIQYNQNYELDPESLNTKKRPVMLVRGRNTSAGPVVISLAHAILLTFLKIRVPQIDVHKSQYNSIRNNHNSQSLNK